MAAAAQDDDHAAVLLTPDALDGDVKIEVHAGRGAQAEGLSLLHPRSVCGAQHGDDIWVSGTVGDAYAALMCRWGRWQVMPDAEPRLFARMDRPTPRIALGQALLGAATACADISDGLLADLDHILTRSCVSAEIEWERIPLSPVLSTLTVARQHEAALAGGDDYELIFTAPPAAAERIFEAGLLSNTPVSRIGRILEREETAVVVRTADGLPVAVPSTGYDHFNAEDPE